MDGCAEGRGENSPGAPGSGHPNSTRNFGQALTTNEHESGTENRGVPRRGLRREDRAESSSRSDEAKVAVGFSPRCNARVGGVAERRLNYARGFQTSRRDAASSPARSVG